MTARIGVLCHASTAAIRGVCFPGGEPLDDRGRESAGRLRWPDPCRTGPEPACAETAAAMRLLPEPAACLRGLDHGRWRGQAWTAVVAAEPDALATWLHDPDAAPHGGETVRQLVARVGAWLDAQDGPVLAVTEAAVVRAAAAHALGLPAFWRVDVPPLALLRLSGRDGRWNLVGFGPAPGGTG